MGGHSHPRMGWAICIFMLFVALLPVLFSATTPSASASPGWWNVSWTKRENIYIIGSHPENYQLKIVLPFFDNSIRFLENEDSGVLPYWIENYTADNMTAWVRRLENSDEQIYAYYGNASVGNTSNIENTFIAVDNFEDNDASDWTGTMTVATAMTYAFEGDYSMVKISADGTEYLYKSITTDNGAVWLWIKTNPPTSSPSGGPIFRENGTGGHYVAYLEYRGPTTRRILLIKDTGNTVLATSDDFTITSGAWYKLAIGGYGDNIWAEAYDSSYNLLVSISAIDSDYSSGYIGWRMYDQTAYVDLLVARKYASPEPTIYMGNAPPTIVNVTSSQVLCDRKQDVPGSGAILTTTITVRIRDMNGKDNMTGARIAIRDNTNIVRENMDVWASRVAIDENTYDVSYTYNPADNLPDNALGNFDVWAYTTDSNSSIAEWNDNKFIVNDGTSTITFNPTSPYSGWTENISGTISRVGGGAASATSVVLIDNRHGTFGLGVGNSWSETYTVLANPNENVKATVRWIDGALDGVTTSSYKPNENIFFTIELRYENTDNLIPDPENISGTVLGIENRNMTIKFYWIGGTYSKTMENNTENIIFSGSGNPATWVQLNDNNKYWRGLVPDASGGLLRFFLVSDSTTLTQYQFILEDHTNMFGPPNETGGQIRIRKWKDNDLMEINDDHWDAFLTSYAYLIKGDRYYIYVYRPGELRSWGMFQAEATTSNVLKVYSLVFGANPLTISNTIALGATRQTGTGYVVMSYQDNAENTENIIFYVYGFADNILLYTTFADYTPTYSATWTGAENAKSYTVRIEATNTVFGSILHELTIETNLPPPTLPSGPPPPFHLPMPLATIGGLMFVFVISMSFSAIHAFLSALSTIMVAGLFVYMGWFPLSIGAVLGFLAVGVIIWKLTSGR